MSVVFICTVKPHLWLSDSLANPHDEKNPHDVLYVNVSYFNN